MLVRPCVQNVPRKNGEINPSVYSLHPRESGSEVVQAPGGVTTSPTLLGPVLVWSHQNYLGLLLIVRFFRSSEGCCRCVPQRKTGMKSMDECGTFDLGFFFPTVILNFDSKKLYFVSHLFSFYLSQKCSMNIVTLVEFCCFDLEESKG